MPHRHRFAKLASLIGPKLCVLLLSITSQPMRRPRLDTLLFELGPHHTLTRVERSLVKM